MTSIRKALVKWLVVAVVAAACSTPPPAILPSNTPQPAKLTVIAAGADGPVAGLKVCASSLSAHRR